MTGNYKFGIFLASALLAGGAQSALAAPAITFSGNSLSPVEVTPERSTGIDKIYVLYDTAGVTLSVPVTSSSRAKIYKYSNLGGAYAEEITGAEISGGSITLRDIEGNLGYIVEDGDNRYYYWIVNYKPFRFAVSAIAAAPEQMCEYTALSVTGSGDPIHYYTINGRQMVLDREIRLDYDTQEWNEKDLRFDTVAATRMYESLGTTLTVTPPAYCSTAFHISGDRFLTAWNWTEEAESIVIQPHAVAIYTTAEQVKDDGGSDTGTYDSGDSKKRVVRQGRRAAETGDASSEDSPSGDNSGAEEKEEGSNQIKGDEDGLGGSAPADIQFRAYVTEGVIHHEWQMSKDPEFENIDYRFNQQDLDYTFTEEGTFYLRYIGSNADGTCEAIGDTYTVNIGGSELLCPNAFTPDGDGVNDKWKVAYRSLLDFKCWIFDRYGRQLYYSTNPDEGWDGMRKGDKPVKSGVYYYVIQATGADGKKYKKSGDINIIRHITPDTDKDSAEE